MLALGSFPPLNGMPPCSQRAPKCWMKFGSRPGTNSSSSGFRATSAGCCGSRATCDLRARPNTPSISASVSPPSTRRASTPVVLLPERSTRASIRTAPLGTGARKVVCKVRNGTSAGTSARIARNAKAACNPPNTLRPCIQSSPTAVRQPLPSGVNESSSSEKSMAFDPVAVRDCRRWR